MTTVTAPNNYTRTTSGRRTGAFTVFASFAVSQENFDRAREYLERRVAEDAVEKARKAIASL